MITFCSKVQSLPVIIPYSFPDTSLKEASQSQDTDEKLKRNQKEIEILDNAIEVLEEATRPDIMQKQLELKKLKKDLDKELRDLSIQHNTSLEIEGKSDKKLIRSRV